MKGRILKEKARKAPVPVRRMPVDEVPREGLPMARREKGM